MNTQELILEFCRASKLYRRETTIRSYYYILRKFFSNINIEPSAVSKKIILHYCNEKETGNLHIRVMALKRAMKQFFIYLNEEQDYKLNLHIFDNIKVRETEKKRLPVIRFEDAVNIVKSVKRKLDTFAKRRDAMLLMLYALTGIRKSEVIGINLNDVDLKNGFINIWQTKNNQPRSIPIPDLLIKYIEEYLIEREEIAKCNSFIITFCGKPITESCLTSIPQSFKKMHGISFSFHSFRRGYASDLYSSDVKIANISRCMGHARISTTLNYYIYTTDVELRGEVSKHPAYSIREVL